MQMCLQTYRIEWINACLTLVGLRTVSNDVVQRLLKLVREYLQENQKNLYSWEWPNYLTTELYYGAATELANEGHYVPSVLCLRMVTAEVQSRSDMPLSSEIQNLLHGNVKWDERIIAADFLLKEIERVASEL